MAAAAVTAALVAAHFNLSLEDIAKLPNNTPAVVPI
jgi:hypothetical protein